MAARQAGLATPKAVGKMTPMTSMGDLLGPDPILLPPDSEAEQKLLADESPATVAAAHPSASVAWAALAEEALDDDKVITAYAYARTGYHRGLDKLRRNGWKGFGPVPYAHESNQGFLRRVPLTPSARPTSTGGVWTCSTIATRRPVRCSGSRRATLLAGRLAGQLAPAVEAANRAQALSRHFRAWRR